MSTAAGGAGGELTHCEWCGAEYPPAGPGPRHAPARSPDRAPAGAPAQPEEPATHCEWCGAEYPVPGEDA
jgi:hypothetical protein